MKLNVKPVYVHLVHRSAYMGPCRGGTWEQLERSYDEMMAAENFAKMKEGLEKVYGGEKDICLQEPVYLEFLDEFVVRESHFEKVKDEDTDVFLLDGMMGQHLAVNIAKRYRKPMVTVGCCTSTDTTACLRAAGFEGYGSIDLEGTKPILKTVSYTHLDVYKRQGQHAGEEPPQGHADVVEGDHPGGPVSGHVLVLHQEGAAPGAAGGLDAHRGDKQQAHALHPGDAQHLPDGQSFGDDVLSPAGLLAVGLGPDRQSEEHQGRDAQLDAQRHPVAAPPPRGPADDQGEDVRA